ncbi:MAG: hypothetical protein HYX68_07945 [Planctomycetes bacterium]|nr:hypothetical protein [Planctomycetota bacterium]
MTTEHFEKVLLAMIRRRPFKPFTVELHGDKRFEIDHPEATVMRQGVAIFMAPGPVPIYFDHDSVVQIIDSPASTAPGKEDASHAE